MHRCVVCRAAPEEGQRWWWWYPELRSFLCDECQVLADCSGRLASDLAPSDIEQQGALSGELVRLFKEDRDSSGSRCTVLPHPSR